jgi:hypothetical protein
MGHIWVHMAYMVNMGHMWVKKKIEFFFELDAQWV